MSRANSARPASTKKYQAVVIGAGMSGLSAAVELFASGITNIIVLEADNRIGGRIHTIPFRINYPFLLKFYEPKLII